ncbi:MAG TPA: class F sortase [Candidatus Paceibacterota bacterium]|nr:class F sortase [Candidatus Paceibacterota bacterium]
MKNFLARAAAYVVVVFASLLFVFILVRALFGGGSGIVPPDDVVRALATTSAPVRLSIPALSIDAHVQYVGTTRAGDIGVPSNFIDVAWYKNGPLPGTRGSAIMDGHVDNGLALPGVFKHLSQIKVGDSVYVETGDAQTLHFVVYDVESYPYKEVPLEKVFAASDAAHLNLITCQGSWVPGDKTYNQRLVVYTTLAN